MWEQDSLLRQLAAPTEVGLLTVSTDRDAWIFIDGMLVRQSPLYQFELPPGEHLVQIASCPNNRANMYQRDSEVSWQQYWEGAHDGSCDEPSPEDLKKLIAEGRVVEKVISEHDGIQQLTLEYGPEINFCCDSDLTKEFTVDIGTDPLIFVWSFARESWILERQFAQRAAQPDHSNLQEEAPPSPEINPEK